MPTRPPTHKPLGVGIGAPDGHRRGQGYGQRKALYDSAAWRRVRCALLAREPLCRECATHGRRTPAACVDHITPLAAGGDAWVRSNLQPLCTPCHSAKTIAEQPPG